MTIFLDERYSGSPGETINAVVGMSWRLESGELLNGVTSVAESGTSDFTISNSAVNAAAIDANGTTQAIGQALQFTVAVDGGASLGPHAVIFTVTTDASQTITRGVWFDIE